MLVSVPPVRHPGLVDTCSSRFRTEVFQVRYQQVDGQVRHLIGLRDFTDQQSLARKATDEICEPEVPKPAETAHSPDEERKHDFEDLLTLLEVDLDCMQVGPSYTSQKGAASIRQEAPQKESPRITNHEASAP